MPCVRAVSVLAAGQGCFAENASGPRILLLKSISGIVVLERVNGNILYFVVKDKLDFDNYGISLECTMVNGAIRMICCRC